MSDKVFFWLAEQRKSMIDVIGVSIGAVELSKGGIWSGCLIIFLFAVLDHVAQSIRGTND